jgi:hypothetical protein
MTLVKVTRKKAVNSAPKFLGGLALIENNELMKDLSQIDYSRKLWVDMQIDSNRREWEQYNKALRDCLSESDRVVTLIQSSYKKINCIGRRKDPSRQNDQTKNQQHQSQNR